MPTASGARRFDPRHRLAERLRTEFASQDDAAEIRTAIANLQHAVDALSTRLDQLEERFATHDDVSEVRREIAVVRTGVRAVTNTVAAIDVDRADDR